MRRLKLYLETSVWSYYYAEDLHDKKEETRAFMKLVLDGKYDIYISDFVKQEIDKSEEAERIQLLFLLDKYKPVQLEITSDVYKLADKYIKSQALPRSSHTDAMHVAVSSVYNLDAVISWNCRHLANLNRKSRINGINIQNRYRTIDIVTPMEVMYYEGR